MGFCEECINRYDSCKAKSLSSSDSSDVESENGSSEYDSSSVVSTDSSSPLTTSEDVPFDFSKLSISTPPSESNSDIPFDFSKMSLSTPSPVVDKVGDMLSDLFVSDKVRSKRKAEHDGDNMTDLIERFNRNRISPKKLKPAQANNMNIDNHYKEKLRPLSVRKTPVQAQQEQTQRLIDEAKEREARIKQKRRVKADVNDLDDLFKNVKF